MNNGICAKCDLERNKEWWAKLEEVVESKQVKILWDFPVQMDIQMPHNQPGIILLDHQEKTGFIIYIAVPRDEKIKDSDMEIDKYPPVKIELERLYYVTLFNIVIYYCYICYFKKALARYLVI